MELPNKWAKRRMDMYDMLPPRVREAVCYLQYNDAIIETLVIHGQFITEDEQLERIWRYHNRSVEAGEYETGVKALVVGRLVHV